jgi:2-oxo-4-hydroxy-4-carboxy-5-ureidoimidazoline decarboxylase
MTLDELNAASHEEAVATLLRCCGSRHWAERMAGERPFASARALYERADDMWRAMGRKDHLQAFAAHPRIGDREALRAKFASTAAWAEGEQAGAARASNAVLDALADGNRAYEQRFGHIFIVCATGKSAEEMLALLRARLGNEPDDERDIAAEEQRKITRIRLEKLLS